MCSCSTASASILRLPSRAYAVESELPGDGGIAMDHGWGWQLAPGLSRPIYARGSRRRRRSHLAHHLQGGAEAGAGACLPMPHNGAAQGRRARALRVGRVLQDRFEEVELPLLGAVRTAARTPCCIEELYRHAGMRHWIIDESEENLSWGNFAWIDA